MSQQRTPVSEVIRNSESFIHRVIDIRRRAAELSEQAARLQEEAYLAAVDELGVEDGAMAFGLACRGLGVDPTLRSGFAAVETPVVVAVAPAAQAPAVAEVEAPVRPVQAVPRQSQAQGPAPAPAAVSVVEPVRQVPVERPVVAAPRSVVPQVQAQAPAAHGDPSRLVRYGVEIKRAKLSEAEDVIEQARRTAAQNRKANPYAEDRGRNAWRNTLFAAVLAQESGHSEDEDTADVVAVLSAANVDNAPSLAEAAIHGTETATEDVSAFETPTEDTQESDAVDELSNVIVNLGEDDDVLDDASSIAEPAAPPPPMPSRAVAFTNNPVQSAPQQHRAAEPSAPPQFARQTSFSRAAPAPSPSTPEVHVDRPVQNRTFAHGQAVPMPKSLKEALTKKAEAEDEKQAGPTISPAPIRRPPPSFLDNRKDRT
ncbi:hypothetical protein [Rhizobium sp. BK176]|uniref:hypothetical protein n=1 Tax=Rhizobium sp. BK176 TaxID=2587071 RepID=UPI0021692298|nr:hypothetical protein [Rhizobium sp. BK176]MCS4089494.1 hypothetical protein [Rhizobium sp. BK176]